MRFNAVPNKPRALSAVVVGVAPGRDARWRTVTKKWITIDRSVVLEAQRVARARGRRI